ncbi:MAG: Ig-like domain-containing protein [Vicinamibacterales bacterium]
MRFKRGGLTLVIAALLLHSTVAGQQAGQNIPVLPVVAPVDPSDPASLLDAALKGDLHLQRQLEPTIAVSTRNPNTVLTFFNDYRAVDIQNDPGLGESRDSIATSAWNFVKRVFGVFAWRKAKPNGIGIPAAATAAEAWIGGSRSYDGGITWSGLFVPGAPFDSSPASMAAPIKGLQAATDPVLAAGPCGRFYLGFLAFTRNGASSMVVARYVDLNNESGGDTIIYEGMTVIESANNASWGYFLDKPSIAVDPLRTASAGCGHNVYVAYTTFNGLEKDGKFKSKITFAKSSNSGATFATQKLNMPYGQNQNTVIAVDPREGTPSTTGGGTVYVAWRHFFAPDTILLHKSTNFGQTFSGPPVDLLAGSSVPLQTFDQPTVTTQNSLSPSSDVSFRTNSVPTLSVVGDGTVVAAWQERVDRTPGSPTFGQPALQVASTSPRIVLTRSTDRGASWSQRQAVDIGDRDVAGTPPPGFGSLPQPRASGPQVMPRLAFGGGRLLLTYYESRGFMQGDQIVPADVTPPAPGFISGIDRIMDLRAAVLNPVTGALLGSSQVSRYPVRADADLANGETLADIAASNGPCAPDDPEATVPCVRRVHHPNDPHSAAGTAPFIGDYVEAVPVVQLVPKADQSGWRWATEPSDVPYGGFHTVWADNRNLVRPTTPAELPLVERYPFYSTPIGGLVCTNSGSRNTDVLTSNVNAALVVSAPIAFKQLENVQRAFPVFAHNGTAQTRFFRFSFSTQAIADYASFDQFDPAIDSLDVQLFPFSGATRVVYLPPSDVNVPVTVNVQETLTLGGAVAPGGLTGTVAINVDGSNPPLVNSNIATTEVYSPGIRTPGIRTPGIRTPGIRTPGIRTPGIRTTAISETAPDGTIYAITDVTWTVSNEGNTTAAYSSLVNIDNPEQYDGSYEFQLIVSKGAFSGALDGCSSSDLGQDQVLAVIPNPSIRTPSIRTPGIRTPGIRTATFFIPPSESGTSTGVAQFASASTLTSAADGTTKAAAPPNVVDVTLRAYQMVPNPPVLFQPELDAPSVAVLAQSCNTNGTCPDAFASPDLAYSVEPSVSVTAVRAGGTFTVSSGVLVNQGEGPALAEDNQFRDGVYLVPGPGPDGVFGSSDDLTAADTIFIGSIGAISGQLDKEQTAQIPGGTLTVPIGTASGTYTLLLMIDDGREVSEVDEVNNVIAVPFTVLDPNTAPLAEDQSVTTAEDTAAAITLSATDADGNSLTFAVAAGPSHGTLSGAAPNLTYTPQANYFGSDTFTFRANDGKVDSNLATVSIDVTPVNDAPVAGSQTIAAMEDLAVAVTLSASDVEADSLSFAIASAPTHGTLTGTAPNLTYTPAPNYFGSDSFTFRASDGSLTSNIGTVSINVGGVNDAPVATADAVTIGENSGTVLIDVLANDSDAEGNALSLVSVSAPTSGTAAILSGRIAYTPAPNFAGVVTLAYVVSDGLASATGSVTVTVDGGLQDYGFLGLQDPWGPGASAKIGSAFPLVWQYTLGGVVVNSSAALPEVHIRGPYNCSQGETAGTLEYVADPGSSGFQYLTKTNTWQFNWQTAELGVGCYAVRIFSRQTRQVNGPFVIRLRR